MGRPKVKIIDDSVQETEENKQKPIKKEARSEPTSDVIASEAKQSSSEMNKFFPSEIEIATSPSAPRNDGKKETKKPTKPGKTKPRSKKYQEITKDLDRDKTYSLNEAVELVKKVSYSKFPGTLEAHLNTAQTGIRGLVALPFASGRKLTILAFGKGAEDSGADIVGSDEVIEEINKGKLNFDLVVTTPEWMAKLAKVARILGPRGLMPNPKNGTITQDLKKSVEGFQAGKTEYKTESKAPVLHLSLGKLTQPNEELIANIKALLQIIGKTRVKKLTLAPTIGPSVKVDLGSI